ncbi:MAG: DUF1616 domain-containing protein [Euryarchaeota archaeon]|nr:DUF1616 domain-containing protein [Euryarchaeota archaeon]
MPISSNPLLGILVLFLLFGIPGYFLTLALFPKKEEFDVEERVLVGFGFSLILILAFGYVLTKTVGINTATTITTIGGLTALFFIVYRLRIRPKIPTPTEALARTSTNSLA